MRRSIPTYLCGREPDSAAGLLEARRTDDKRPIVSAAKCPKLRQIEPHSGLLGWPDLTDFVPEFALRLGAMIRRRDSVGFGRVDRLEKVPLARCFTLHDPADQSVAPVCAYRIY